MALTYGLYDASAYDGIAFWARGTPSVEARIGTAATTSTKWGGTCTLDTPPVGEGCVPHERSYEFNDEWVQYWLPFDPLDAAWGGAGWGSIVFDRTKLTNFQFRVAGSPFDFWVDDISFFVGRPGCCSPPPAGCEVTNLFPDLNLKKKIALGDFACEDVCTRQTLDAAATPAPGGVQSLQGLQCLADLRTAYVNGNQVADLSPIAGLTRLHTLGLSQNLVTSIAPLANLTRLTNLNLSSNQLSDVGPLAGLVRLTWLFLSGNRIGEIDGLSGLTVAPDQPITTASGSATTLGQRTAIAALTRRTPAQIAIKRLLEKSSVRRRPTTDPTTACANRITPIALPEEPRGVGFPRSPRRGALPSGTTRLFRSITISVAFSRSARNISSISRARPTSSMATSIS
jgi:hypothetical protein